MSHTPGPWEIHPFYAEMVCDGGQNVQIANMFAGGDTLFPGRVRKRPKKEREANARLIAAAPELLKACKFFLESFGAINEQQQDALTLASRAIAKAEGEKP